MRRPGALVLAAAARPRSLRRHRSRPPRSSKPPIRPARSRMRPRSLPRRGPRRPVTPRRGRRGTCPASATGGAAVVSMGVVAGGARTTRGAVAPPKAPAAPRERLVRDAGIALIGLTIVGLVGFLDPAPGPRWQADRLGLLGRPGEPVAGPDGRTDAPDGHRPERRRQNPRRRPSRARTWRPPCRPPAGSRPRHRSRRRRSRHRGRRRDRRRSPRRSRRPSRPRSRRRRRPPAALRSSRVSASCGHPG